MSRVISIRRSLNGIASTNRAADASRSESAGPGSRAGRVAGAGAEAVAQRVLDEVVRLAHPAYDHEETGPGDECQAEAQPTRPLVERAAPHEADGADDFDDERLRGQLRDEPGSEEARYHEEAVAVPGPERVGGERGADDAHGQERSKGTTTSWLA